MDAMKASLGEIIAKKIANIFDLLMHDIIPSNNAYLNEFVVWTL